MDLAEGALRSAPASWRFIAPAWQAMGIGMGAAASGAGAAAGAFLRRWGGGTERKDDKGRQQNEGGAHGKTPDAERHGPETQTGNAAA